MTTMTPTASAVTGGVDTHADMHVAAAVDQVGGVLGTASSQTTPVGDIVAVGIEDPAATVAGRRSAPAGTWAGDHGRGAPGCCQQPWLLPGLAGCVGLVLPDSGTASCRTPLAPSAPSATDMASKALRSAGLDASWT